MSGSGSLAVDFLGLTCGLVQYQCFELRKLVSGFNFRSFKQGKGTENV